MGAEPANEAKGEGGPEDGAREEEKLPVGRIVLFLVFVAIAANLWGP